MGRSWVTPELDTTPLGVEVDVPKSSHPPDDPIELVGTLDGDDFGWAEVRTKDAWGVRRSIGVHRNARTLRCVIHTDEIPQGRLDVTLTVADQVGNLTEITKGVHIYKGEETYGSSTSMEVTQGDRVERSGAYTATITHEGNE